MGKYLLLSGSLLALAACNNGGDTANVDAAIPTPDTSQSASPEASTTLTLDAILAEEWRSEEERVRDAFRHPKETLEFFEVTPDQTVVEIWPGGGWYTNVLAPYLKGEGTYVAAGFDPASSDFAARAMARFTENYVLKPDIYGDIEVVALSAMSGPIGEPNSADTVLTFRNVHNWMANSYAEKVFADMYAVLKPGGIMGVVEHRLPSAGEQDPRAATGYVHEDFVKQLASEAGFEFVEASEINANPKDTADHPFGVWTLPPNSRTTDRDGNAPEGFDPATYLEIGESDRMTLKFRKPLTAE